jgi:hypothetical protein
MPEQEPLQPPETEAKPEWVLKSDGVCNGFDFIQMPETPPATLPVYLIDGVAHPTDKEPAGFHVTKGVKYANVDEALKHMANAEAPESMIIPYLQEKIKANEDWLAAALTKLSEIETVKLTELSDKVQALEEAAVKEETIISKG